MREFLVIFRDGSRRVLYSLPQWGQNFKAVRDNELVVSMCNNPQIGDVTSLLIVRKDDGVYKIFDV